MRSRILVAGAVVCVLLGTLIAVPAFVGIAMGAPGPGYGYGYHATPPQADAGGPYQGDEGSAIVLDASGSTDPDLPDNADIVSYEWDLDGDGEYDDGSGETVEATFGDNGQFTVSVRVTDMAGNWDRADALVTVSNVPPQLMEMDDRVSFFSESVEVQAAFSDAGWLDTHIATIDWGDGAIEAGVIVEQDGAGTISGTHVYASQGEYTATISVTDDDGDTDTGSFVVTVLRPVTKYALFSYETLFAGVNSTVSGGLVGGNGDVWVLTDASIEDVVAVGDVRIWNRASTGDITAGGTVGWFGKGASTGTITEGADVNMLSLPMASANPDTTNNIRGNKKGEPLDLQPGRYGMVFANGANPVILHGGEYDFMELSVGYGTHMTIDLTNGEPLVVRVKGRIHFVGNVEMEVVGGSASDIVFLADGSLLYLGQSGVHYGTFIAPHGRLEIGVRSQLVGAAWGHNVNAYHSTVVWSPYLHAIP